jgi:hypothetical protein
VTDRQKPGVAFWAAVGFAVLLIVTTAYVALYLWTVCPGGAPRIRPLDYDGPIEIVTVPIYSFRPLPTRGKLPIGQEWLERFFKPAHWLDRKFRPEKWERRIYPKPLWHL